LVFPLQQNENPGRARAPRAPGFWRRALAFCICVGAAVIGALLPTPVAAQQPYPTRPIRLIVPYPAGAAGDILARLFGDFASTKLGQPFIIDNRPGGAGIAATDTVARAEADGYTLLLTGPNHVTNVGLAPSLPYDPDKDFAFIGVIGTDYVLLMAHPKSGFRDVHDLIAKAKAKPRSIDYSSSGVGTGGHLAIELFQRAAGIELVHIPYRGATPALTDTVSGQVPLNVTAYAPASEFLKSGLLVPLVIASPERLKPLPNTPTGKEVGLGEWVVGTWFGLSAPARTPPDIIAALERTLQEAVQSPVLKQRLEASGTIPGPASAQEFTAIIRSELQRWPKLIRDAGKKLQ
jgi:tripartite-type tricarboxylate transporter receptor subunit TctC